MHRFFFCILALHDRFSKILCEKKGFIIFCCIGVINTALDFSVYVLLTQFILFFQKHFLFASGISIILASTSSFFMNKRWTFDSGVRTIHQEYVRFFTANMVGLLVHTCLLYVLVSYFGLNDIFAKICVIIFLAFLMYSIHKNWTFYKNKNT